MVNENEPVSPEIDRQFIIIAAIFSGVLLTICVLTGLYLYRQARPRAAAQQAAPIILPTAAMPTAAPVITFPIRLPVILSGSGALPVAAPAAAPEIAAEQIWEVIHVKSFGYEKDGQRYDLATFQRVGSQDTVKGYCINPGWDTPVPGVRYLLTAGGILVPLNPADADSLQSFLTIPG